MSKLFLLLLLNLYFAGGAELTGSGNKFVKCGGLLSSSSDICFESVLSEIVVEIGAVGTEDDVILEICSDVDKKQCCKTPPLKSALSNDWKANSKATLGEAFFGPCNGTKFLVKRGLDVTLSKSKEGQLQVKSIEFYAKSSDKKVTDLERFQCGSFDIGGSKLPKETKQCATGPYHYHGIEKMIVQVGPKGTNDKVNVRVCSDTNDVCCSTRLSHLLSDDWKKDKKQEWTPSDFSDCAKIKYKVTTAPVFSVIKDGKDDLAVASVEFYMQRQDSNPSVTTKFACEAFNITGDCKQAALCTYTFAKCAPTTGPTVAVPTTTTTKAPAKKSKRDADDDVDGGDDDEADFVVRGPEHALFREEQFGL